MSSQHPLPTTSAREYAAAYATHYTQRDLTKALHAYDEVIVQHPESLEAEYSRAQLRNIVRSVVPSNELLATEVRLAHEILGRVS